MKRVLSNHLEISDSPGRLTTQDIQFSGMIASFVEQIIIDLVLDCQDEPEL